MPDIQHAIVIDAPADQILQLVSTAEGQDRQTRVEFTHEAWAQRSP